MKRKLLALLLASVMVLSLVACGQKETPDTPETPDDQEEVKDYSGYTIRIYSNSNSTAFMRTSSSLTGLPPGQARSASTPIPARPTASSSRTF